MLAGREAFALWTAWHYGGEDPYRLYRLLDQDYRPVWDPELPAERPRHPQRVRRFMYGLGRASAVIEGKMDDRRPFTRTPSDRPQRAPVEKGVVYGPRGEVLSAGQG